MSLNDDNESTENVSLLDEAEKEKEPKKKFKLLNVSQLWWLLKLGLSEWFLISIGTFFLFITAGSGLILPGFIGSLVDQVSHADENGKIWLMQISLILFGIFLVQGIATFIRAYSFSIAGERIVANLRRSLFNSTICQDIGFFDKTKTGELLNRLASDTKVLESTVTVNFSMASRYMIQLLGGVILLFVLSWKLTLIMLAVIPVIAIIALIYGRWVKSLGKKYQDALARTTDIAEESLGNVRTVRSFAQEIKQKNTYGDAIDESFRLAKLLSVARGTFGGVMMVLGEVSIIGVVWYGGTLVIDGEMSMGSLTSFIIYTLTVAFAFGALASLYFDVSQAVGATERVYSLIHRQPEIEVGEGGIIPEEEKFQGKISFKNVSFSYPTRPDQQILKQFNLELNPGEVLALVGESGGGKSTVASLIQRFYDVDGGSIEIDGIPLKELDYVWYRKQIAAVNQEPSLFGYTIGENIAFGKIEDVSEAEIIEAAKKSNAHDFIMEFPEGYKTIVGERGVRLSGGQKQRIAIARALLKNPKILVLDEFSSALDAQSEFLVQQALNRLMSGRTCLIIAHRLSTVQNSNVVCVVEKGEIIEKGNHEDLMKLDGVYARFVEKQLLLGSQDTSLVEEKEKITEILEEK